MPVIMGQPNNYMFHQPGQDPHQQQIQLLQQQQINQQQILLQMQFQQQQVATQNKLALQQMQIAPVPPLFGQNSMPPGQVGTDTPVTATTVPSLVNGQAVSVP